MARHYALAEPDFEFKGRVGTVGMCICRVDIYLSKKNECEGEEAIKDTESC